MKTTKAILFAALMAFASFGFSQSEAAPLKMDTSPDYQIAVLIQLRTALNNPGLVTSMHAQLDVRMIGNDQPFYTLRVAHRGVAFFIKGTTDEWKEFFSSQFAAPPEY